jgi:hypothetical protein
VRSTTPDDVTKADAHSNIDAESDVKINKDVDKPDDNEDEGIAEEEVVNDYQHGNQLDDIREEPGDATSDTGNSNRVINEDDEEDNN